MITMVPEAESTRRLIMSAEYYYAVENIVHMYMCIVILCTCNLGGHIPIG